MNTTGKTWNCGKKNPEDVTATLEDETLTLRGQGEIEDYENSDNKPLKSPWKYAAFSNLHIEEGITKLGRNAFRDCRGLTSVSIADSVTHIEASAFAECKALTSIKISKNIKRIGYYAFYNCVNLQSITIFNAEEVPELGTSVFQNVPENLKIYVPKSMIKYYEKYQSWPNADSILPISDIPSDSLTPQQIDEQISDKRQEIEKLEQEIADLEFKKLILRGTEGNPKDVAQFMALFNQRDGLKYLTHDFDETGEFNLVSFLDHAKKVCGEYFDLLRIPQSLKELLHQFIVEKKPKWKTFDNQYNPKEVTSGWSSLQPNTGLHPIRYAESAEMIKDFKRVTRIESPNLETLIKKVFHDESYDIEMKDLHKADFYTHVGELELALKTIFEEIEKHSEPNKKKVSIEYKRENDGDYFVRKIVITHHDSYPTKGKDVLVKEWSSLEKGNMGKIAQHLQGYCHWSVITTIDEQPMKINILRENEMPECEDIEVSNVDGFTHILTFYYQ